MKIDCQTAQELIPASVLNVLEADEQTALLDHLQTCASCRAEADSLRPVVDLMGLVAPDAGEPALSVKQRMLAGVQDTVKPRPKAQPQPRRSMAWRWGAVFASVAVALLVIAGLGAGIGSLQTQVSQQQARLDRLTRIQTALRKFMLNENIQAVPVTLADPTASAVAALYVAEGNVAMSVTGLPPLDGDSVYQCWWIDPQTSEMVAGTTFKVDENGAGVWVWPIPPGDEYTRMTVTRESQSDHSQAEGPVIMTADF